MKGLFKVLGKKKIPIKSRIPSSENVIQKWGDNLYFSQEKKNGESTAYCLALKYTLKEVLQAKVVWYSTETELYKTWGVLERS